MTTQNGHGFEQVEEIVEGEWTTQAPSTPERGEPSVAAVPPAAPIPVETVEEPVREVVAEPAVVERNDTPALPEFLNNPLAVKSAQALINYIADNESSEVLLNGKAECVRKVGGVRYACPDVVFSSVEEYHEVINHVILKYCDTPDRIGNGKGLIEGRLEIPGNGNTPPLYARTHIIAPPGVRSAVVTVAKRPRTEITLDDMVRGGSLSVNAAEFVKVAARGRKTIVVSGGSGAGKTTVLQAISHFFDANDRIIIIEDTPELQLPQGDVVYLKATTRLPGMTDSDVYSLEFWVRQANRMRADRIIVGETRGSEFSEWLVAANSGAEGSATTVHANSPQRALDKMLTLASKDQYATGEEQLRKEIAQTVDIIVQADLINGRHIITTIEEVSTTVGTQSGQIQTSTLFKYDKDTDSHVAVNRPSDGMMRELEAKGTPVKMQWFRTIT